MDLSAYIRRRADRYLPIEEAGVTLYPILVADLELFESTRPALEFMHQILPVEMMQIPLLTALYQLEMSFQIQGKKEFDLFTKSVLLLTLALRLGPDDEEESVRIARCRVEFNEKNPFELTCLRFRRDEGGEILITPQAYEKIRHIIAAQNGAEIQPYDANPKLIIAERQILAERMPDLKRDPAKKIAWVAAKSGVDDETVFGWPILKFERRAEVLQLEINYLIYGVASTVGLVKFENGNPCPSPYFARDLDALPAKMLSSIGNGAAEKAVAAATGGENPTQ